MTQVRQANISDIELLLEIGVKTFIESHGHSAPQQDISDYVNTKFTKQAIQKEVEDSTSVFYIITSNQITAGYSKIIFNNSNNNVAEKNIAKLERLYVLKEFYGLKIGKTLFEHNIAIAKENNQAGIWLNVWVENHRAIQFYQKAGFILVGHIDFPISTTHSNPNHQLYLSIAP